MQFRNARHVSPEHVDCEIQRKAGGKWMPFCASQESTPTEWAALMASGTAIIPYAPPSDAERVVQARREMQAYKFAFFQALSLMPGPDGGSMLTAYRRAVDTARADDPEAPLALAYDGVTIYQRWQPQVEAFRAQFGMTEEDVDLVFEVAMAIDAGATEATILALLAG